MLRLCKHGDIRFNWDRQRVQNDHTESICILWHGHSCQDTRWVATEDALRKPSQWGSLHDLSSFGHLWDATDLLRTLLLVHVLLVSSLRHHIRVGASWKVRHDCSTRDDCRVPRLHNLHFLEHVSSWNRLNRRRLWTADDAGTVTTITANIVVFYLNWSCGATCAYIEALWDQDGRRQSEQQRARHRKWKFWWVTSQTAPWNQRMNDSIYKSIEKQKVWRSSSDYLISYN